MTAAAPDHDRTKIDWLTITHSDGPHLSGYRAGYRER